MLGFMKQEPVRYRDRYTGEICHEAIYGERWLRWAYENPLGRAAVSLLVARGFFSRIYGWRMQRPASARLIPGFIAQYQIDPADFVEPVSAFGCFNDFFCRQLRPEARPLPEAPEAVTFPADGRHMGFAELGNEAGVFVKGQRWNLAGLVGDDPELLQRYEGGALVLSRLCPTDYHHFHFPKQGKVTQVRTIKGPLYSVSPIALRHRLDYMWRNKRVLTRVAAEGIGEYLMIEVGATNVGSIKQAQDWTGRDVLTGQRKGWFEFGGSSVITLFPKGSIRLADDLLAATASGLELYARVNDLMAMPV